MNLLLELMKNTTYRDADEAVMNDWRGPFDWARALFGPRASQKSENLVGNWLEELANEGLVDFEDRGEGVTLYRAALA